MDTFNQERLNIDVVLLLNGYPPNYISHYFQQFFKTHNVKSTCIYKALHEETYQQFHEKLLNKCVINEQSSKQVQQKQRKKLSNKQKIGQKDTEQRKNKERQLIIHHRYENEPLKMFNRNFHTI